MTVVIWDLSEVLIGGLYAIDAQLASDGHSTEAISRVAIGGDHLIALFKGNLTEQVYLTEALRHTDGNLSPASLRDAIHDCFRIAIDDSVSVFREVNAKHRCVLLTDHCKEWAQTVQRHHSFLTEMDAVFWSFETGHSKREAAAFTNVLGVLDADVTECLFIDDRADNVEVATSIGIDSIQFENAVRLRSQLLSRGVIQ